MKTLLITIISLTMGTALLRAQGLISFNDLVAGIQTNTSSYYAQDIGSYVSGKTFTSAIAPDGYNYIVLAATSTNAADLENPLGPDWSAVTFEGESTLGMGTNNPASGGISGSGGASPGFASDLEAGSLYYIMAVGWSSNLGDWTQIQGDLADGFDESPAGYFGVSYIGTIVPAEPPGPPATVFGGTGVPPDTMVLYAVPEPTTLAMAGLAMAGWLATRRRKA